MYNSCIAIRGFVKCDDLGTLDKLMTKYDIMYNKLGNNVIFSINNNRKLTTDVAEKLLTFCSEVYVVMTTVYGVLMLFTKIKRGNKYYCTRGQLAVIDTELYAKYLKCAFHIDALTKDIEQILNYCAIDADLVDYVQRMSLER